MSQRPSRWSAPAVALALWLGVLVGVAPATPTAAASPRPLTAFRGLGTWIDVFDWSVAYGGPVPSVGLSTVDRMADEGVTTLYVQTTSWRANVDVLERDRLVSIIDRAHARGMSVVGWYLPTFVDLGADLRRLQAMVDLGVDAVGVDVEDRTVADPADRTARLLWLSAALRQAMPAMPLSAIVVPPVAIDVINPSFWPGFPWAQLADTYDVFQPMGYWSYRTAASGYHDGYRYTAENIDRIRTHTGRPNVPVHPVGGVADTVTVSEVQGMVLAAAERGALGVSLYDWVTTRSELWSPLRLSGGVPIGRLEQAAPGPRSVVVGGWALDPDTAQPIEVHVYVDGVGRVNTLADRTRPDVAAAFADWGAGHGFSARVDGLTPGSHEVCVYAVNRGRGGTALLGCPRVAVPTGSPWGNLERYAVGLRSVRVAGWAVDPDAAKPIEVHVYVDGIGRANVRADRVRGDLNRALPGWAGIGGFDATVLDVAPGRHDVCVFAINLAAGVNRLLRCDTVVVRSVPAGVLELAHSGPRQVRVAGWAVDPDAPAPAAVHVYVDGVGRANVAASMPRPDLATVVPGHGIDHGFDVVVDGVAAGDHEVCVYALDSTPAFDVSLLGCRAVRVPSGSPVGVVDSVGPGPWPGSLRVTGWTLDPDTAEATEVHVYVDGIGRANVVAALARPDVARVWRLWGAGHGVEVTVDDLAPGAHVVCVFAIDRAPPGGNTLLECRSATATAAP